MRFIIVGAGLSGLSCGAALAMMGHDAVIIEKETEEGGLARSFRIDGYTFDYGPHYLFGTKVLPLLKEVLCPELELMDVNRSKERMYFKGKYFKFPFEPKNLLLNMEPMEIPGVLFDLCMKSFGTRLRQPPAKNVEDWVIQSVGRRIYDYTSLGGYIEKLYGVNPREISEDWGIQKLKFLAKLQNASPLQLAGRALREEKRLAGQVVSYPSSGVDRLALHIGKRFIQKRGKIYFGSDALAIEKKGDTICLVFRKNRRQELLEGDFLISTIPMTNLLRMLNPPPPENIAQLTNSLRYRTVLLLFLCIEKERLTDHECIYFTEDNFAFRRVTEFKHLSPSMAPDGKTSLCVEITCFEDDRILRQDAESIFGTVVRQLEKGSFLKGEDIEKYHVLRIPYAYPVYEIGYRVVLKKILEWLSTCHNIISVGRQGLFFYNTMSNSIVEGYMLGRKFCNGNAANYKGIIQEVYQKRLQKYEKALM